MARAPGGPPGSTPPTYPSAIADLPGRRWLMASIESANVMSANVIMGTECSQTRTLPKATLCSTTSGTLLPSSARRRAPSRAQREPDPGDHLTPTLVTHLRRLPRVGGEVASMRLAAVAGGSATRARAYMLENVLRRLGRLHPRGPPPRDPLTSKGLPVVEQDGRLPAPYTVLTGASEQESTYPRTTFQRRGVGSTWKVDRAAQPDHEQRRISSATRLVIPTATLIAAGLTRRLGHAR